MHKILFFNATEKEIFELSKVSVTFSYSFQIKFEKLFWSLKNPDIKVDALIFTLTLV